MIPKISEIRRFLEVKGWRLDSTRKTNIGHYKPPKDIDASGNYFIAIWQGADESADPENTKRVFEILKGFYPNLCTIQKLI